MGSGDRSAVGCRTRDRKVSGSSSDRSFGIIFSGQQVSGSGLTVPVPTGASG